MITPGELESLRAAQKDFLPDLVTVQKRSFVGGEEQYAYDTVASDVACRLTPGFGVWKLVADRYQGVTAYTVTFAYGQELSSAYRLIDATSHTYEVREVMIPKSYATAVRALLDLVS